MTPKKKKPTRAKYGTQGHPTKCCNGTERCTGRGEKHACTTEPTDAAVVVRTRRAPSPKTVHDTVRATDEVLARLDRVPTDEEEATAFLLHVNTVWYACIFQDPQFKEALMDLIAKVRVSTERRLRK